MGLPEMRLRVVGILLAAGAGTRFGGGKLLATMPDGASIGERSCEAMKSVLDEVIAVVRPGDDELAARLSRAGARVCVCDESVTGMGASVANGVLLARPCDAVVVALADMPWVAVTTLGAIVAALDDGASLVVPRYRGCRGNPIGFGASRFDDLTRLSGDRGARDLIDASATVTWLDVDDPGILRDVDVISDLQEVVARSGDGTGAT